MSINTLGVIGAGTMGSGIAQIAAAAGFTVTLVDVNSWSGDRCHRQQLRPDGS
jgi:3-hydroxybutyryl-CoA dehydrogenase